MMEMPIVFGLLSAALYGATDLVARFANKGSGVLRTMLWGQACVTVLLSGVMVSQGLFPHADELHWLILAGTNLAIVAGTGCLYYGLAIGRVTVVTPVMASYGAVSAIISALAGEAMTWTGGLGIALAGIGAVVSGIKRGDASHEKSGWLPAAAASFFYGAGFWAQGRYVLPSFGPLATLWLYYLMATVVVAGVCGLKRAEVLTSGWKQTALILVTGLLAAGGYAALAAGQATGQLAITTALSAGSTAVTVLLAFVILKERPGWQGWLGVIAVAGGVALIHLAGSK